MVGKERVGKKSPLVEVAVDTKVRTTLKEITRMLKMERWVHSQSIRVPDMQATDVEPINGS